MIVEQNFTLTNGLRLKNRIVKAATSETMGDRNGNPTTALFNLYRNLAEGGTGLIISGNVMVERSARGEFGNVVVDQDSNIELLTSWAKSVENHGSHFLLQLNHPGRQAPKTLNSKPVAPSAIAMTGPNAFAFNPPRALKIMEIKEIVQKFAQAAELAETAGFSGVEIHAAHGYLLNQFLSPAVNRRHDQYGGSLANRMRIVIEIYEAIRARTRSNFTVAIKLNAADFTPNGFMAEESLKVMQELAKRGIDLIEISGGSYENPKMMGNGQGATFIEYARMAKQTVDTPIIVTGGFRTAEGIKTALSSGDTDLIGLARPLILQPDLPEKLINGKMQPVKLHHFSTGWSWLDHRVGSLIGLAYYEQQMARLANGKPIKQPRTAWPILLEAVEEQGLQALIPRRR
ncbi:NADH:flavin oxidoreductase/NADH oxidase family protein [Limosilactobacillus reuteri]|uniref:NADH:flavin oxidoreductase/NADH oxidase family protein n=1 Tax=Limosilactobacillus reuteri TaxID=1598 RepID=UPI0015FA875E|nr:NADH:flavin oxidoreductase/NADH oxidase family protein [Limosilactobacillus reuteri]MBB1071712.1 NADH:flavin oxidoreductase/NADH oxidase family protein [Limosilactobacillus reuteri]MCC4511475.1 NADH:flavin oxidoreductase/NADH oxidase family protein [Limosilactobacillus reuteri]MCC4512804.1 NADH:flavin oxidoreductase/NADH oxidase family protein [Limosilactobacillus reuteri]